MYAHGLVCDFLVYLWIAKRGSSVLIWIGKHGSSVFICIGKHGISVCMRIGTRMGENGRVEYRQQKKKRFSN